MKTTIHLLAGLLLALAGCTEQAADATDQAGDGSGGAQPAAPAATAETEETAETGESPAAKPAAKPAAPNTLDRVAAEKAVAKGVAWLRGQAKDGMWMANFGGRPVPSPATTALALTPIAHAMPESERAGDPLLSKASGFLLAAQREDGAIDTGGASTYENYFTSAALMALAAINDPGTAGARDRMRKFLLTLQRLEEGRNQGGFGYNKRGGADLSNAQYAIEALRTAGISEDDPAMRRARAYLERVQNRSENEANKGAVWVIENEQGGKVKVVPGNDGSAGYEPGVSKAGLRKLPDGTFEPRGYGSMTYALLKCYILTGLDKNDERVRAAVGWTAENYGWDKNPGFEDIARETNRPEAPYWGLYYYYVTAAKALRLTGLDMLETPEGPRDWRADLAAAIVKRQAADGSWINDKASRWFEDDKVICTAYALIALQEALATG